MKTKQLTLITLPILAAFSLCFVSPAAAQEDEEGAAPEEVVQRPRDPDGPGFSRVADAEETIYALQRKAYLLSNRFEVSVLYTVLVGDRFVSTADSFGLSGSFAYHLSESFALEAFGGWFNPTISSAIVDLDERAAVEPAKRTELQWAVGAGIQWTPIYGKLKILGGYLGNFAFYLGAGGAYGESRAATSVEIADPGYIDSRGHLIGVFSGGFRFLLFNRIGLKLEVKDYIFPSQVDLTDPSFDFRTPELAYTDSVRNNIMLLVGLSVLLGGETN